MKRFLPYILAAMVLVGGLVHLKLYFDGYRSVPNANLGRSFILNGVAGAALAIALIGLGAGTALGRMARLATAGWAGGSLIALAMSRTDGGIFGFTERGWNPAPETAIAVIAELGALVLTVVSLLSTRGERSSAVPDRRVAFASAAIVAIATIGLAAMWARKDDPAAAAAAPSTAQETQPSSAPVDSTGPASTGSDASTPTDTQALPAASAPADSAVAIVGFAFSPKDVTVAVGTTITWTNQDSFAHSTRSDDGSFDSPDLAQGETYSHTFDTPGTYAYVCGIHNSMTATVIVEA